MGRSARNLACAAAAALPITLLILACWTCGTSDGEPAGRIAFAAAESGVYAVAVAAAPLDIPLAAATDEEVRDVVLGARRATDADRDSLRRIALDSTDPLVAGNAVRALGRLRAVGDDPELSSLLQDARPRVREEMVVAIGASDDSGAVELLLPLLLEPDGNLRALAMDALGRLGGARARAALDAIARDDGAPAADRVHAQAALALLDHPDRPPVSVLVESGAR